MGDYAQADPALLEDVDLIILDHVLYFAANALINERRAQRSHGKIPDDHANADSLLQIVDSFITLFRFNHPNFTYPTEIDIRLRVLKLTVMLCRRFERCASTPPYEALKTLRTRNSARARQWFLFRTDMSEYIEAVARKHSRNTLDSSNRETLYQNLKTQTGFAQSSSSSSTIFYHRKECPSLLDILPDFMFLSSTKNKTLDSVGGSELWMELAGNFMLLAAAEQYAFRGAKGAGVLFEAFAWGWTDSKNWKKDKQEQLVSMLFQNNQATENVDWRKRWMKSIDDFFQLWEEQTETDTPLSHMEDVLLDYLQFTLDDQPKPILAQLELGSLQQTPKSDAEVDAAAKGTVLFQGLYESD